MYDPNEYTVTSRRTTVDGDAVFEARVIELPDVVGYGETRGEAETAAIESISGLQDLAREMRHTFPAPNPVPSEYSGRVTLRVSRSLHRQVALLAHLEDVSLNQFINEAIAERVAARQARATRCYNVMGDGLIIAAAQPAGDGPMIQLSDHYGMGNFASLLTPIELLPTTGQSKEQVRGLLRQDVKSNWYLPEGDLEQ
jgi:predicted HicB family RNase H-like nuclease